VRSLAGLALDEKLSWLAERKAEMVMRSNHESLGTARGIIMAIVGVLILVAFLVSRLHLLGFVGK